MFSRVGSDAIKPGLQHTLELCKFLGEPQDSFKSIHIAGTNGKGSTSHMIASILQCAGYKTGLYTSPHLKDFRERIKINGQMIGQEDVINFTERIIPLIDKIEPSFFEITVAMAFDHFAKNHVDVAVVEVGLGGRLDSTNIIHPVLSVITNIGWDHMNILGDSLEKIATEKAGIIKNQVPVVIGETNEASQHVFEKFAQDKNAPIIFADRIRYAPEWKQHNGQLEVWVEQDHTNERKYYQLDLPGIYQLKNLITVLESISQLKMQGFVIEENHIFEGLSHSKRINGLHGRWELIQKDPQVIADVAHNADGIQQILAQLEMVNYHHLHIVIGMVKDKEVEKVLALLPKEALYYFTKAQIPRALDEQILYMKAASFGLMGKAFSNVHDALREATFHAKPDDLVLVCGSVFLVAEL